MNDIEARARALYDACLTPKPAWEQLGETTKSVWRERAANEPVKIARSIRAPGKSVYQPMPSAVAVVVTEAGRPPHAAVVRREAS